MVGESMAIHVLSMERGLCLPLCLKIVSPLELCGSQVNDMVKGKMFILNSLC
jgi:hypothetical protein